MQSYKEHFGDDESVEANENYKLLNNEVSNFVESITAVCLHKNQISYKLLAKNQISIFLMFILRAARYTQR